MNTQTTVLITPKRRADILQRACEIREHYDPRKIDEVAAQNDIVLVRTSGPVNREAGFAYIEFTRRPVFIESLSHPEEPVRVWGAANRELLRSIIINKNSGIPECEVFWHEYWHLFYSPNGLQRAERFEHHFSTEAVLHNQEERRADEFAAAILAPYLLTDGPADRTLKETAALFEISERLAERAIRFYSAILRGKEKQFDGVET